MNRLVIHTPLGPVPLVGRLQAAADRPALLAIGGMFPPKDYLHDLIDDFPGDVVVGALPGMKSPIFREPSFATFSAAYDAVVTRLFPSQPVVVLGVSTGALVAMGMRAPSVRALVLVEPFLSTAKLWPLIAYLRTRMDQLASEKPLHRYLFDLFGVTLTGCENRDYQHLADRISVPAAVLCGGVPMNSPRELPARPSLTDDQDRQRLTANPHVRLYVADPHIGHDVPGWPEGRALMVRLLRSAHDSLKPPS